MKNKYVNRIVAVVVATILFLALLPTGLISVSAATLESGKCGDNLTWNLDSAGNLTISGTGAMYNYSSKNQNGTWATTAPWGSDIKTVTISSGVTSIGMSAFYGCTGLTSVTIGNSVTSIDSGAFCRCTGLTSVTIPNSVTEIVYCAFSGCTGLTSVTIPDSVTSIGYGAFSDCTGLTSITVSTGNPVYHSAGNCLIETGSKTLIAGCKNSVIPSDGSVASIYFYAFEGCTGLTSVTIPNSVTSIGVSAFEGCTGLTSVTIGNSVTSIGNDAFYGCTGLTSVTIGNSVTSIGDYAFYGCTGLTSVTIPDSVTSIGDYAFSGCKMTRVTIPDSVTSIGMKAFDSGLVLGVCEESFGYYYAKNNKFNYTIAGGKCGIDLKWRYENRALTIRGTGRMTNYSSTSKAPWGTGIKTVTISSGVTSIGDYAFYGSYVLTSITIPDSVTSIGDYAFYGCTDLTSVRMPDSVTSIGGSAFKNTGHYKNESNWENGVLYIDKSLIEAKDSISANYDIKNGTVCIADNAFNGCADLTSVAIPNSLINIGNSAFDGCGGLRRISIPESVEFIGDKAFYNCADLARITISGAPDIGADAFVGTSYYNNASNWQQSQGHTVLCINSCLIDFSGDYSAEYEIPREIVVIAAEAFAGCKRLLSVTIPRNVKCIGKGAFDGCNNITLNVTENSCGHRYAKENNIRYSLNLIMLGDPDDDGEISVADALAALRVAAKLAPATDMMLDCCDIDADGEVTVADALSILRVAAKLASSL